jgi:predicted aminopeptidase
VYVGGDSQFNESFATAVEEAGVERWLARFGNDAMREGFVRYTARKREFLALLLKYRRALEANYASQAPDADKRSVKARLFGELKDEYLLLKHSWGGYAGYDRFFAEPLSNAHLASIATYNDFVPAFRALLRRAPDFPSFYKAARRLAELERPERHRILKTLAAGAPGAVPLLQRSIGTAP